MRIACPIIDQTHGTLQNLFGCDCVDGQHPNFAKYFGQPCRTLLKPTSGAMYYIKVPGPTSPSIRDCRSFWKWKKLGRTRRIVLVKASRACITNSSPATRRTLPSIIPTSSSLACTLSIRASARCFPTNLDSSEPSDENAVILPLSLWA